VTIAANPEELPMARVEPLPPKAWPAEMREALAAIAPPPGTWEPVEGRRLPKALNNLGTFGHHPDLARAYFTLNGHLLHGSTLTARQRMLLVLRLATVRQSAYMWSVQTHLGLDAGISEAEIARVAWGPDAPHWSPPEALLLRTVDELVAEGRLSEETWTALSAELDTRQILDAIFTIGSYETFAFLFRSFALDLDDDLLADQRP
jgi:alkylhydroperoxidase family enzyme